MSAGLDVDSRATAPDRGAEGANFAVEPHEQIFRQAMERFAAIGDEWAETLRRLNGQA